MEPTNFQSQLQRPDHYTTGPHAYQVYTDLLIYSRIFCSLFLKQQATESIFEEQLPASLQFFLQYITVRGRPVEYSDAQRHKLRGNEYFRHSTFIKTPVLTLQSCDNQGFEL